MGSPRQTELGHGRDLHVVGGSPPPGPWKVVVLDVDEPIDDVPTGGAAGLFVTASSGGTPLASVIVTTPLDPYPAAFLAADLGPPIARPLLRHRLVERHVRGVPPSTRRPSGTVVVCTKDRPVALERCLRSIEGLAGPALEVLVVDNGTDPATSKVVEATSAKYLHEPLPGLDRARNRAIATASGEVLLFTDDDMEVDRHWAKLLLACFDDPLVMAATGLVLPAVLDTRARQRFELYTGFSRGLSRRVLTGASFPPTAAGSAGAGASMAVRASFLRHVGGFPEELDGGMPTASGGDTYVLYTVLRAGLRIVYEPRAIGFHAHRASEAELAAAMQGYWTGVGAYLAHGALQERDPAAALAAVRWGLVPLGREAARIVARRRGALPVPLFLSKARGFLSSPAAYRRARRIVHQREPVSTSSLLSASESPLFAWSPGKRNVGVGSSRVLSIVVPSRGRRQQLLALLGAIDAQRFPADKLDVVVALDGDVDGSTAAVETARFRTRPRVICVAGAPARGRAGLGPARARNDGAAAAQGELLLFLDDDVIPAADDLLLWHVEAQEHLDGAVVGPCLPTPWAAEGVFAQKLRNWWSDFNRQLTTPGPPTFTKVLTGNLSLPRAVFEVHGGFREIPRREDWELGCRLLAAAVPLRCEPNAVVLHHVQQDVLCGLLDRRDEGRADVALVSRHPESLPQLPLATWEALSGKRRQAARRAVGHPAPMAVLRLAAGVLRVVERVGSRSTYDQLLAVSSVLAYWSGVGDATGSRAKLLRLLGDASRAAGPPPVLDLAGPAWDPPTQLGMHEFRVTYGGRPLGTAPLCWGGTPWNADVFVTSVIEHFLTPALTAAALAELGA